MNITAVVLSRRRYTRAWPGLTLQVHQQHIRDAAGFQRARFDAIAKVRTERFFFLDDDDELPADYLDVLAECVAAGTPVAYTDQMVGDNIRRSGVYSQEAHLRCALLVHHLALYETAAARAAVERLPRGHFYPEMMLAWEVAKAGVSYVPRVGYRWIRSGGMHTWPSIQVSQVRTALWCKSNP